MRRIIGMLVLGAIAVVVGQAQAAGAHRAPESCGKAHALFFIGDSASAETDMQRIRGLLQGARGKYHFEVVEEDPDSVHKIQLKMYTVTGSNNLRACVGHCSHGGTCNQAADLVAEQNVSTPNVYCGNLPNGLE